MSGGHCHVTANRARAPPYSMRTIGSCSWLSATLDAVVRPSKAEQLNSHRRLWENKNTYNRERERERENLMYFRCRMMSATLNLAYPSRPVRNSVAPSHPSSCRQSRRLVVSCWGPPSSTSRTCKSLVFLLAERPKSQVLPPTPFWSLRLFKLLTTPPSFLPISQ